MNDHYENAWRVFVRRVIGHVAARSGLFVFLAFSGVLCAWWWGQRAPWIHYPLPLNADEAQVAATALNVWGSPWIWLSAHNHTVGPLAPLLVSWPKLFGQEITLASTRATGFVVELASFVLIAAALYRLSGRLYPAIAVLPFVVVSGLSNHPDLLHLSSEKLPALALSAALLALADWSRRRTIWPLAIAGFILGLVPFLKLQGVFLGLLIGALACALAGFGRGAITRPDMRSIAIVVGAALIGPIFFIFPTLIAGRADYFFSGYLMLGGAYAQPFNVESSDFIRDMVGALFLPMLAGAAIAPGLLLLTARRSGGVKFAVGAFGVIYFALALVSVYMPGREFPHYAYFLFHAGPVLFGTLIWALVAAEPSGRVSGALTAAAVALPLILVSAHLTRTSNLEEREALADTQASWAYPGSGPSLFFEEPLLFDFIPGFSERMFVWGWMPEYYLLSGRPSVARDTHTQYFLEFSEASRAFHREDFMERAEAAWPFPILDATVGSSFAYRTPEWSIDVQFPEFWDQVRSDLVRVGSGPEDCPRLFLPASTMTDLESVLIRPQSVSAEPTMPGFTANALTDFSVYENCRDYWLASHGNGGEVRANFPAQDIARVALLNTRNHLWLNHGADRVRVTVFRDGAPAGPSVEQAMAPHPTWTFIDVDPVLADEVVIEIVDYVGLSGGLNEIKIYSEAF